MTSRMTASGVPRPFLQLAEHQEIVLLGRRLPRHRGATRQQCHYLHHTGHVSPSSLSSSSSSSARLFVRKTTPRRHQQSAARQWLTRPPSSYSSYSSPSSFSTLAGRDDLAALLWAHYFPSNAAARRHRTSPANILASSSAATSVVGPEQWPRQAAEALRRWIEWLHAAWVRCKEAALVAVRGTEVVLVLSPLLVLAPTAAMASHLLGWTNPSDWTWGYATSAVQRLGPAFVKLCQWVATRRDLFPPPLCDRLSKLHDKGTPHRWNHTERCLRQAFGDFTAKGLTVYPEVIGCGSAAQVHRGTLRVIKSNEKGNADDDDGEVREVAVKVLHPRFGDLVERDLRFLQAVANWLHALPSDYIRMLNLPKATQNFGAVLRRQADLRVEGDNLRQFRRNFYSDNDAELESSYISFPRPMEDWVDANVLVEEMVRDATPIAEYLKDSSAEGHQIRKELAGPLLRAFLKMVFIDNFIHSDLHPGNVLIRTSLIEERPFGPHRYASMGWLDGWWPTTKTAVAAASCDSTDSPPRVRRTIVFLDAGIATSLSPDDRRNLHDLFRAVILNDGDHAGRLMVERAKSERCSSVEGGVDAFASGIRELVSEFHDCRKNGLTLGAVRIGSLLGRVLDLCRVHGVEIDPSMASVVVSTLVLEGLGRSLAPSLNLIDFAVPFVLGRGRV